MALFNIKNQSSVNENMLAGIEVQDFMHEAGIKGAFANIVEIEQNYAALMEAVAVSELTHLAESGEEIVYEGGNLTSFFGKLKEFFKSIYVKIKGLFQKFIATLDSWIKSDSDFVKKYRQTLLQVNTKDFTYNGYEYTLGEITVEGANGKIDAVIKAAGFDQTVTTPETSADAIAKQESSLESLASNKQDVMEEMRGAAVGSNSKLEMGEFTEKLHSSFRNNEDKPVEISNVNVSSLLEIISNFTSSKKEMEKGFKELEKQINETIKTLEKAEKEIAKTVPGKDNEELVKKGKAVAVRYISTTYGLVKDKLNILQSVYGAKMSAAKEQNRAAKAVCTRLINYKPKNESFVESGSSLLDNVKFK